MLKEGDSDQLGVVRGRLIKAWFGVAKLCMSTAQWEAIRCKQASQAVFYHLR